MSEAEEGENESINGSNQLQFVPYDSTNNISIQKLVKQNGIAINS